MRRGAPLFVIGLFLGIGLLLAGCATGQGAGGPERSGTVQVAFVATNDFHGGLLSSTPSWARGDTVGGAAVLAGYIEGTRARYPGAVVWLDGGDVMQGTLISNLTRGRTTVRVLDAMGLDAAAVGNHEFDWSVDTLRARMEDAEFAWLSANVFEKATGERPAWLQPTAWLERAGLRIAVIGASTIQTPATTMPEYAAPYEFRDIADVVNELVPGLRAEGADLVVLAVHAGAIADSSNVYYGEIVDAARRIEDLDLIVSGHTHSFVETVENGIPIIQARAHGTAVGTVVLTYDRASRRVVDHAMEVTTTYARDVTPAPAIAALVEGYREEVREIAERPIATLAGDVLRGDRGEEWPMGNLIADAQRSATGARISVMNPGGVRAELRAGPISFADVYQVQPFQNTLVVMELTGAQVAELLEAGVADRIGHVSGVRFSYDPTLPYGDRVRDAALEDTTEPLVADGEPVHPEERYTVVVNSFLAAGGDTYGFLKDVEGATNTGIVDSDVLADYLGAAAQPVTYAAPDRITPLAPWPAGSE